MKKPGADRNSASGQVMVLFRNRIPTNGNRCVSAAIFHAGFCCPLADGIRLFSSDILIKPFCSKR